MLAAIFIVCALGLSGFAHGQDSEWRHATSLIGEPKYPPDFTRFDYVNPDAPKGGVVRLSETGGFDSLNFVPPRGEIVDLAPPLLSTLECEPQVVPPSVE